ncbi:Glycosyl hydrolase family 66 [Caprobacter fermentans]|uniref:Glycosyl hydrolase family 66 n=1 Tax=Caproicibacter fermentans TaxID=2576756 RepID=A0A6N8I369_9FIRM|nr:glycoside hydrolase family 66 protein [Caproicibacter fermentans]MVB12462.1 Glycosyl hydrolase family 66 [Caproicibacter fermentans]QNK40555.1 hypothetical protein HCR03_18285 [Caproicibacter fermentans]
MIRDITPLKAQFSMNEPLAFEVHVEEGFSSDDTVKIRLFHLGRLCFEEEKAVQKTLLFQYAPPNSRGSMEGYWVQAIQKRGETVVSRQTTACDRAVNWRYAPRYGFLSDFEKENLTDDRDILQMNRYHLNVIQFYDWMYRHDDFFPPKSDFTDIMGKASSMDAVKNKIGLAHRHGMKAFAYGAVYGAEKYRQEHPECSLYDGHGEPMKFIDRIYFMDISRGSEWHDHILGEYKKAVEFGFDGIHMDQYGFPKEAYAKKNGKWRLRKLREDFPALINDTKAALPGCGAIFNAVNNWPADAVADTDQDCVYIEVWSPNDTYFDLTRLIADAKKAAPDKQVILAAYLLPFAGCDDPQNIMWTAFLAMATIFSSGGFHLLLGEENGLLTQAYYSDYCRLQSGEFVSRMLDYYDFITAYEELLFDLSLVDDTRTHTGGINEDYLFAGAEFSTTPKAGCVWTQIKHTAAYRVIHLVNFTGIDHMDWNRAQEKSPDFVKGIHVDALVAEDVEEVRLMSPDLNHGESQALNFTRSIRENGCRAVQFSVPELKIWDVIAIKVKLP